MQGISVAEAMQSPAPSIAETATLLQLRDGYRHHHTRALCVVTDEGRLTGIVTLGDLQRTFEKALEDKTFQTNDLTVGDICTRDVVTCYPDDPVWTAIRLMGGRDIGRLPVVHHRNGNLLGMLRRSGIMNAYNVAIAKKLQDQHTVEQIRLHTLTGAHVLTYPVTRGSPADHKAIRDIDFPPEVIVASIQRSGKLIVPHGSTVLLPGDTLTIVADPHAEIVLEELFRVRVIPGTSPSAG
jgi:CIC family chloride channel protein